MLLLALGLRTPTIAMQAQEQALAVPGRAATINSRALPADIGDHVEYDLKVLICWCVAVNPTDRPSLLNLLAACDQALAVRNEQYYSTNDPPRGPNETDSRIGRFVQDMILEPDVTAMDMM